MKETMSVPKIFLPDSYDKEEQFLTDMSKKGWHFSHIAGLFFYVFVKGEQTAYSYKLDFQSEAKIPDRQGYLAMYADCGWEHIYRFGFARGKWEYFRKESQRDGSAELFTDNESLIEMLSRIRRFYLFLGIVLIGMNAGSAMNMIRHAALDGFGVTYVAVIYLVLIALYAKIFAGVSMKIKRLRRG